MSCFFEFESCHVSEEGPGMRTVRAGVLCVGSGGTRLFWSAVHGSLPCSGWLGFMFQPGARRCTNPGHQAFFQHPPLPYSCAWKENPKNFDSSSQCKVDFSFSAASSRRFRSIRPIARIASLSPPLTKKIFIFHLNRSLNAIMYEYRFLPNQMKNDCLDKAGYQAFSCKNPKLYFQLVASMYV